MAEMEVDGIIPREIFDIKNESTAVKQTKFGLLIKNIQTKLNESAEKRQIRKDDKLFNKIRGQLVERVFHRNEKHIKGLNKKIDQFKKLTDGMTEADQVDNLINIADGANADKNSAIGATAGSAISGGLSIISSIMSYKAAMLPANAVISLAGITTMSAATLAAIALGVGIVGASLTMLLGVIALIKLHKGKKSDTLMKQLGGMEKAQQFVDKIEKFVKEIENDKKMLIEKKKEIKDKEQFNKFLDQYLEKKSEFLKDLGVAESVNALKNAELEQAKEEQQKGIVQKPVLAGAMG